MQIDPISEGRATASCGVAVMAKASKAGRTKTRLANVIGTDHAALFNTAFLKDIAESLCSASATSQITGYMAFGPPGEARFFDFLPPQIGLFEAWEPNFGETLKVAIRHLLDSGHEAACVLNADSPTLPTSILVEASQILTKPGDRVVLGPSNDGGYYLLGMKAMHEHLFANITWSTEHVTRETLERAADIGLEMHLLPEWYDVDDALSLEILRGELLNNRSFGDSGLVPAAARHTRALMARLEDAVLNDRTMGE